MYSYIKLKSAQDLWIYQTISNSRVRDYKKNSQRTKNTTKKNDRTTSTINFLDGSHKTFKMYQELHQRIPAKFQRGKEGGRERKGPRWLSTSALTSHHL